VLTGLTVAVVVTGLAVRLAAALAYRGVIYPDETYQMTEPAHHLVFGYGITAWEFRMGTRSWLGPGLLLPPTLLWRWLGLDGVDGPGLVRAWVALGTGLGIAAAALLARRLAGAGAGLLAAVLVAFSPLGAVFEVHPFADTVAAPLVVTAVALLTVRRRTSMAAAVAGVLLVAALVLRPQLLPVLLAVGLATVLGAGWARARPLAFGVAGGLLAGAVLDVLTWGVPFAPLWRSFAFNVVDNGASRYGQSAWSTYLTSILRVDGPVLALVLTAGLLLACRRPRGTEQGRDPVVPAVLVAGLGAFLVVLSAIGHKELRFLVPALPLAGALAAVGLGRWLPVGLRVLARRRAALAPRPGVAVGALAALSATAALLLLPGLTMADLNYPWPRGSAWRSDDTTPRLLGEVGRLPGVCGVVVFSERLSWTGGYTALHRDVSFGVIYRARTLGSAGAWANVVVTSAAKGLPAGYRPVAAEGDQVAGQRAGGCAPPPASVAHRWI
jgi:GPI mannosyltransferase 3